MNNKSENESREKLEKFINDADLEKLEEISNKFNIFNALDLLKNEVRHSNFLSWLLNPNETHGLGSYFLTSFLKKVSSKASSLKLEGPSIFDIISWKVDDAEIM